MATTYITLVNDALRRLNEVTLDISGDGFDTVRNVQGLVKDAVNNSIRLIIQDGQEYPFLKTTNTQTLTIAQRTYDFPTDMGTVDWDSFFLKKTSGLDNTPRHLKTITYNDYIQNYRTQDDEGDQTNGIGKPLFVYQTLEEKFGVTPLTDAAYEVEYVYFTFPADLSLHTDTTIIPDRFKHVIIDGAIMFVMRFRSNEQSAAIHQQNFEEGIKAMRRILLDDNLYVRSTVINRPQSSTFNSVI
jgi:hypothetical protein